MKSGKLLSRPTLTMPISINSPDLHQSRKDLWQKPRWPFPPRLPPRCPTDVLCLRSTRWLGERMGLISDQLSCLAVWFSSGC